MILREGPATSENYLEEDQGQCNDTGSVHHLSREQCLLEAKRSRLFFKNGKKMLSSSYEIQGTPKPKA